MLASILQLGFIFQQHRNILSLTQEQLSEKCDRVVTRTAIALLEQGRRLPKPQQLATLGEVLGVPRGVWEPFAREESAQRHELEAALTELVGEAVTLKMTHVESSEAAEAAIRKLFSSDLTPTQAFDMLNSILVFYGIRGMKRGFFDRYFTSSAFHAVPSFEKAVRDYQREAIRLYSTFAEAYQRLNTVTSLDDLLGILTPRDISGYGERIVWEYEEPSPADRITRIEESKLQYLGYISAESYKQQRKKRKVLAKALRDLALNVRAKGKPAVAELGEKKRRQMDSLLRELGTTLKHTPMSPLFVPNPAELEAEASRILRDEKDVAEMENTQSIALRNLSNYVSADYIDVYVATSMRKDSDYISVNRFVSSLFHHEEISPLRLRYFNPTQSWIEDRVAKGLVEALMLRRADVTVYMAQKEDSFGKDSEASVALGQGKPVIVFVPKLSYTSDGGVSLDSEELILADDSTLTAIIKTEGKAAEAEVDETLDHAGLFSQALTIRLRNLTEAQLGEIVRLHWADFGLLDEAERIKGDNDTTRQDSYTNWVKALAIGKKPPALDEQLREDVIRILVATTVRLEKRAEVFREVHPLALQVILSTGVLNGILVARSVDSCAKLLKGVLKNEFDLELEIDDDNYRLVEKSTRSTIRVISRNALLVNALNNLYGRF